MRPDIGAPASPYKGLESFGDTDLDELFFFGRERDTEVISANLIASRLTVLYGPIGVGKSSILQAGVARRVRSLAPDAAVVVHDSWADDPSQTLLAALADGGDVFLVLDQFEELFAYPHAETFADELARLIRRADARVNVLLAIREDALSELDLFAGRIPNVFGNHLALARLDRAAAHMALTGPIERFNELSKGPRIEIEEELVEAVLDEVGVGRVVLGGPATPAAGRVDADGVEAPYLQLVMERLWERETANGSRSLRRGTLAELGGAQAIVRAHLDEALRSLAPHEQDVAAGVFNHLVTASGTKVAHDVTDLAEYVRVPEEELRTVLASLGDNRILRPVDGRFEIFHDVLADAVLAWRTRHEGERALELLRAEAERRHRRVLLVLGSCLVAVAAMAAVTIYALSQRAEAREQAGRAGTEASSAKANRLAAEAGTLIPIVPIRVDPELGLLLGTEAARIAPTARTADVLRRALLVSHLRGLLPARRVTTASFGGDGDRIVLGTADGVARVYSGDGRKLFATLQTGKPILTAVLSPNGHVALTTERDGPARTWDVQAETMLHSLGRAPTAALFSPDGSLVLTVEAGGARVWDVQGSLVSVLPSPDPVRLAAFDPAGVLVVTAGEGPMARIFDVRRGVRVATVDQGGEITSTAITTAGMLVTTGRNRTARIWNLRRGRLAHELKGHRGQVTAGVLSRDGRLLVTASTDTTARVWDVPSGALVTHLIGHTNRVTGAALSPDGGLVVTWSLDGTARVWDARGGVGRAVLTDPSGVVTSASFDPSGDRVLTTGGDNRVRLWNSHVDAELRRLARVPTPVGAASFSDDGAAAAVAAPSSVQVLNSADGRRIALLPTGSVRVLAMSPDGSSVASAAADKVALWSVATGEAAGKIDEEETVTALAFGPEGRRLAIGTANGSISVRTQSGRRLATFELPGSRVTALAFARSGDRLAAGFANATVAAWNLRDGQRLYRRVEHRQGTAVLAVAFGPGGSSVASVGGDSTVRVSSATTGVPSYTLRGHAGIVSDAAFSPNGKWIVTAGPTVAGLWDLASRQRLLFLPGHAGRILAATFGMNGRSIGTVGSDGTLRTYRCAVCGEIPELLRLAERRLAATGRSLTAAERRLYLDAR